LSKYLLGEASASKVKEKKKRETEGFSTCNIGKVGGRKKIKTRNKKGEETKKEKNVGRTSK